MFQNVALSQENIKDSKDALFFNIGANLGYDTYASRDRLVSKGSLLEIAYQRKIVDRLTLEAFYSFGRYEKLPQGLTKGGFKNDALLNAFFSSSESFLSDYEVQSNHFLGLNLHYSFINNSKWYASFYAGMGYSWWKYNGVNITGITYFPEENDIRWRREERNDGHYFSQVGFQVNYTFNKKYVLGVQPSWIFVKSRFESSGPTISNPTAPSVLYDPIDAFLRLNVLFGYRF